MDLYKEQHLRAAADNGDIAEIKRLLAAGADVNAGDAFGFTALEYAMNSYPHLPNKDHMATVKALVEGGANVNAAARNGQTPLFTAVAEGLYDVVVYLHSRGADINARLDTGATAFYDIPAGIVDRPMNFQVTVIRNDQTVTLSDPDEIRKVIGSHPDDEFTARLYTAQYLVNNGIDINAELYESGQTPIFRAADCGAEEIVTMLLNTGRIDTRHTDKWGMTALQYACRQGHTAVAMHLIAAGVDVNNQAAYGFTPLHDAAENGHFETVKLLVEYGAKPSMGLTERFQSYPKGVTALDIAREKKRKKVVNYLSGL